MAKLYRVTKKGEFLAEGTAKEISEKTGMAIDYIYANVKRGSLKVEVIGKSKEKQPYNGVCRAVRKEKIKAKKVEVQKPYKEWSDEEYYQEIKKRLLFFGNTIVCDRFDYIFERFKKDKIKLKKTLYVKDRKHYVIERL